MTLREGNRIIAEFMGWGYNGLYWDYSFILPRHISKVYKSFYAKQHIHNKMGLEWKYNSSWKWLMPVVDKIEHLDETSNALGYIHINSHYCKIVSLIKNQPNIIVGCYSDSPEKIKATSKIDAVWLAVVTWIQWYNKQNAINEAYKYNDYGLKVIK